MTAFTFSFQGETLCARPTGTLWWPARGLLCVSDLHLGKSERNARSGGTLLPPYEVRETLGRLHAELRSLNPSHVIALGDSFDDPGALGRFADDIRAEIAALAADRDWTWIAGNHDPLPPDLPGRHGTNATFGPLTFRHIAEPGAVGEISGHFHPKARLAGRRRPAFLVDRSRIILPAFGAYTGGLDCSAPEVVRLMGPEALAIVTGERALAVPLDTQRSLRSDARNPKHETI